MAEKIIELQGNNLKTLQEDLNYRTCRALNYPIEETDTDGLFIIVLKLSKPDVEKALSSTKGWGQPKMLNVMIDWFPELRQEIIDAQITVDWRRKITGNALHYVLYNELLDALGLALIDMGINVNAKDSTGNTPLHLVCTGRYAKYFSREYVKALLAHGADLNAMDEEGYTPLKYLISTFQWKSNRESYKSEVDLELIEFLIENGADMYVKNSEGNSPFSEISTPEILQIYLDHGGVVDFAKACSMGLYDKVLEFISSDIDINEKINNVSNPLQMAIANNQGQIIEVLLEHGADPNVLYENDFTPLHWAAWDDRDEIVRALLKYGANRFNRESLRRMTALDIAYERKSYKVIRVLQSPIPEKEVETSIQPPIPRKDSETSIQQSKSTSASKESKKEISGLLHMLGQFLRKK